MAPWRIVKLVVLPNFRLQVSFVDGTEGIVDMGRFLSSDLTGTVFEPLKDEENFAQAFLEFGSVTWPGEVDLAPDSMYHAIGEYGVYQIPLWIRKAA